MARTIIDGPQTARALNGLPIDAQWLYLRLRLRPVSPCGVAVIVGATRKLLDGDRFTNAIAELEASGLIIYDDETLEGFVCLWFHDMRVAADSNQWKAATRALAEVESPAVRAAAQASLNELVVDGTGKHKRRKIPTNVRAQVYARDGLRCVTCGTSDDLTIDHVVAVANGGTNDITNLQSMCQPCNSRKHTN